MMSEQMTEGKNRSVEARRMLALKKGNEMEKKKRLHRRTFDIIKRRQSNKQIFNEMH